MLFLADYSCITQTQTDRETHIPMRVAWAHTSTQRWQWGMVGWVVGGHQTFDFATSAFVAKRNLK